MKTLITITRTIVLAVALTLFLSLCTAHSQTPPIPPIPTPTAGPVVTPAPTPPADPTSFFQTAQQWFTSFDTNNLWTTRGSFSAGVDSIQGAGVNLANSLRLSYGVWKQLSLEATTRNTGISGTVLSQQAGLSLGFPVYDAKLSVYADGGYYFPTESKRVFAELGVKVEKKLSRFTFIGISAGSQLPGNRQVFSGYAGFVF